jgi:hypothetical protein
METRAPDVAVLAPVLREVVRGIDPGMPTFDARTMQNYYEQRAVKTPGIIAERVAGLGTMGLILAVVGAVRADRVFGKPAAARDRHLHGDRGRPATGSSHDFAPGTEAGGHWCGRGVGRELLRRRATISVAWVATFDHLNYALFPAIAVALLLITLLATLELAGSSWKMA